MNKDQKRINTLSNATHSSGEGIPACVSADNISADFVANFFNDVNKYKAATKRQHFSLSLEKTID